MSENLIGGVTSVVTADTTKFDAAFKKTGETADATARVVAKAAKLQADGIAFAAKFAGDSVTEQSLRQITSIKLVGQAQADYSKAQRLVRAGFGDEAEGSNLAAAALQRLTVAKLAAAEVSKVQAVAETHAASVSQQQAASAFIRGAEGNVGIRAVERFAISLPGVGAALQSIFPIVGMVATAGIIVKMGTDLYEVEQKGKHAGVEIGRAFAEMNVKLAAGNDELELQTSKIEDEIAKLEKQPTDGLKTSLLEAAVAGDKLQESLAAVLKTEREVLKQQSVGTFESILANVSPTGKAEKEIGDTGKDFEKASDKIRIERRAALKEAGEDQDKQEAANKAYYGRVDALAAEAARKMRQRATDTAEAQRLENEQSANAAKMGGSYSARDLTPRRTMYEGAAEKFDELQRRAQDAGDNFSAEKKRNALVGAKELAGDQDKAAEALLKSMEAELHQMELQYGMSIKSQFDYWELRKSEFSTKSREYNDIVAKQATLAEEGARKAHEQFTKIAEQDAKRNAEQPPIHATMDALDGWKRQDAKVAADRMDMVNELYAEQQKTLATLDATRAQEAAGRTMTQIAAATEMAAIHTREYGAELDRLELKQAAIRNNPLLTANDADRQKQLDDLDKQIAKVKSSRQVQILQDNYSITAPDSSALTGARDALDQFTDAAKDNAQIMRGLVLNSLHSFNDELVRAITGQKTDWKGLGRGVATNVASAGLNKVEGSILGSLGFGKKDGSTEANALWVKLAGIASSAGAPGMPGVVPFLDTLPGGGKTSGDSAGLSLGGILSSAIHLLPGFADGGELPRSSLVMVGEKGPEILNTGMAGGSVIPNHKVADMIGGGGDTHVWNIDATGSSDPAAVELAVHRGIAAAAPGIAASAVAATRERSLRRSSLRR